jgi:hypothetical protein
MNIIEMFGRYPRDAPDHHVRKDAAVLLRPIVEIGMTNSYSNFRHSELIRPGLCLASARMNKSYRLIGKTPYTCITLIFSP